MKLHSTPWPSLEHEQYVLRLYVTGMTPRSTRAIRCRARHLRGVSRGPLRSRDHRRLSAAGADHATSRSSRRPTLVKDRPIARAPDHRRHVEPGARAGGPRPARSSDRMNIDDLDIEELRDPPDRGGEQPAGHLQRRDRRVAARRRKRRTARIHAAQRRRAVPRARRAHAGRRRHALRDRRHRLLQPAFRGPRCTCRSNRCSARRSAGSCRAAEGEILRAMLEHGSGRYQTRLMLDGQEATEVQVTLSSIVLDDVEHRTLILTDISSLARAQRENRSKDEFLAMLAHELRNPLGAIQGAVHALALMNQTEPMALRATGIIKRQVVHMARLVDDLLDVGRAVTGKIVLKRTPLNLADAVKSSIATHRLRQSQQPRARRSRVASPCGSAAIRCGSSRSSATWFRTRSSSRAATASISVFVGREGDDAVLRVADQGIGIPADMLPKIFDLFVQAHHTIDRIARRPRHRAHAGAAAGRAARRHRPRRERRRRARAPRSPCACPPSRRRQRWSTTPRMPTATARRAVHSSHGVCCSSTTTTIRARCIARCCARTATTSARRPMANARSRC